MKKGAVNVAEEWIGGLQKPNGLNCQPRAGYRRCQRWISKDECQCTMKLVLEPSVRKWHRPQGRMQPEPGRWSL